MTATKTTAKQDTGFDAMTGVNTEAFKEGYEKISEGVSAFADFHKGSLEAFMASAGAFAKGVEKLSTQQSTFVKTAFDEGVASAKAVSTSKSVQEALDIQSDYARETIEKNLGQINKVADLWIETTKKSAEPLTSRYAEMVEKIQSYRP